MDVEHVLPVGVAHPVEDRVAQDAGIVDQDVDAAEGVERGLHDRFGVLRLGDRERRGDRLAAGLLDLVHHLLRRAGVGAGALQARADVAGDHPRALLRQAERDAAPDPARGAGDDGDFSGNDACGHYLPQHLPRANSTIIRSLPTASSSAQDIAFLGRGEAALRRQAELVDVDEFRRLVDAALELVLLSSVPLFEVTRPSTTVLPFGTKRSGSKPPARSVSYSMK